MATASSWHGFTAERGALPLPSGAGMSNQASAVAVNAVHAAAAAASEVFAARTQITAVKTAAAGSAYASTEANSAAILGAITRSR